MIKTITTVQSVSRLAGGMFDGVRRLTQCLGEIGVFTDIFSLRDQCTALDIDSWAEQRPRIYDATGPGGYSSDLIKDLASHQTAELAHSHGLWTFNDIAVQKWSRSTGKPYIVSTHGMLNPEALKCSRIKKLIVGAGFEKKYLAGAACIRVLSTNEVKAIRDYGVETPVCVIPNGVDTGRGDPVSRSGQKTLLYLGRLHPGKNLESLIQAWSRVKKNDTWKLKIAGWGSESYERKLKKLANNEDKNGSIEFTGPLYGDDKTTAYRQASSFVLPSFFEGSPVSVLEAWSYGLPVMITPECNLNEGYQRGAALRIGTDIDSISKGIDDIISMSDEDRIGMGEKGRQLVRSSYAWPDMARKMLLVYEWVLGRGDKPECVEG